MSPASASAGAPAHPTDHSPLLRVLIAEDEPVPRRRLARLLQGEPGVRVVAQCSGGGEAVARIREEHPDVVFLDVQMPDLDGFGVVAAIGSTHMPIVVFVTAYDAHAVRAFEIHAVDYLLKPYDEERLRTALARVRKRLRAESLDASAAPAPPAAPPPQPPPRLGGANDHIVVRADDALRVIRLGDVDWFESEGNFVRVHVGRHGYLVRQTFGQLEGQLDPQRFVRIHRRFLVNVARVHEIRPWFGGDAVVVLRDGTPLRLSRTYRAQFHARFVGEANESVVDRPRAPRPAP